MSPAMTPRIKGTAPRIKGMSPGIKGTSPCIKGMNPRIMGMNPRIMGTTTRTKGMTPLYNKKMTFPSKNEEIQILNYSYCLPARENFTKHMESLIMKGKILQNI